MCSTSVSGIVCLVRRVYFFEQLVGAGDDCLGAIPLVRQLSWCVYFLLAQLAVALWRAVARS